MCMLNSTYDPARHGARKVGDASHAPGLLVVLALFATVTLTPSAGIAAEDPRPGRYTMTPADGGFIRLDTETGAIALCAKRDAQWSCEPMPDSGAGQRRDIERLEAENKALKDEIRRMEEIMGLGDPKPGEGAPKSAEGPAPKGGFGLPSEKDVDKAFDYLQRMIKKFQDKMREFESGRDGKGGGTPL